MQGRVGIPILALMVASCSKPLELPDTKPDTSIVVVEGDVVTGVDMENTVLLSRVRSLSDTTAAPISQAKVQVVSENGTAWDLFESSGTPGKYFSNLTLDPSHKYHLRVLSPEGNTFESAPQASKPSPPIDSLTFKQPDLGDEVQIFVHTHDPSGNTRFYRWQATETWARHSAYQAFYYFDGTNIVPKAYDDQNWTCWRTESVPSIVIANTIGLAQDLVSYQPVTTFNKDSEKGYVRYSILVKQIALTKESFNFWNTIKKNTELTGSLFDPQPSQYITNIVCKNDVKKKAIGFVSVSGSTEARMFILNSQLNLWPFEGPQICSAVVLDPIAAVEFLKANPNFMVGYYNTLGGTFGLSTKSCVDCTLTGGTNVKPSFW
jgi:hypothetical protein